MKEARIILPRTDNDGRDLSGEIEGMLITLAKEFGGFTAFDGRGAWIMKSDGTLKQDPVLIVDIAMDITRAKLGYLRGALIAFLCFTKQEAMYMRDTDGNVTFVERS